MTICTSPVEHILNEIQALDPEGKILLYELLEKEESKNQEKRLLFVVKTLNEYYAGKLKKELRMTSF
jgi:hypothetical protein